MPSGSSSVVSDREHFAITNFERDVSSMSRTIAGLRTRSADWVASEQAEDRRQGTSVQ
jgi:hypothetical protein